MGGVIAEPKNLAKHRGMAVLRNGMALKQRANQMCGEREVPRVGRLLVGCHLLRKDAFRYWLDGHHKLTMRPNQSFRRTQLLITHIGHIGHIAHIAHRIQQSHVFLHPVNAFLKQILADGAGVGERCNPVVQRTWVMQKAFAGFIGAAAMLVVAPPTFASDYGCKVLMCLANPNGATAVQECRPPIEQLHRDLAHGRDFPSCDEAKPAYAEQVQSYYDPCPSGTTVLGSGERASLSPAGTAPPPVVDAQALPGLVAPPMQFSGRDAQAREIYIGAGGFDQAGLTREELPASQVCVGQKIGITTITRDLGYDNGSERFEVGLYDRIVLMDRSASPRAIDVHVDGQLYRRVRW
jgi:hypothetical protein